ncbi:MAG: ABC transporter substrate-binding protein [Thermomicrobiales bacterium]
MHHESEQAYLNDALRGRLSRRDLMRFATAVGLSAPATNALLRPHSASAHAQEGSPVAATECTGAIVWALESDPVNLIPYGGVSTSNMWGKEFMYDSLLEWDQDLNVLPALAESFEAAPDGTSYTFRLRQGVLFHDGAEMTAADVKYSFDIAVNPPAPGIQIAFLGNIAGAEVVDDYSVTITMTKPDPTLVGVLAWARYTPIVPEGVFDRINVLSEGIGTGPYQLIEFVPNDRVVYECFPDYWKPGVPCIKNLTLEVLPDEQARVAALRSGEIDGCTLSADVARTLENDENVQILTGLFAAPRVIHLNTVNDVPWRDERVRQAISAAIDRQEIIDNVYGGQAELTGPVPPGYGEWPLPNDELAQYFTVDLDRARQLMSDAGYAEGFSVSLQAISAPRDYTQIAEIIRERLSVLNIDVAVEPLEIGTFAENIGNGNFEWASTGRGMRGDPSGFLIDYRTGTSLNVKWFGDGWTNAEVNTLYDEALATTDQAARLAAYHRIQHILLEGAVNLFSVQPYKFQVARSRVEGMYVSYTDFNPGLRTSCVAED